MASMISGSGSSTTARRRTREKRRELTIAGGLRLAGVITVDSLLFPLSTPSLVCTFLLGVSMPTFQLADPLAGMSLGLNMATEAGLRDAARDGVVMSPQGDSGRVAGVVGLSRARVDLFIRGWIAGWRSDLSA